MVQFWDKNWSSMLALCTHAAWDAYNYANSVEGYKALFTPPPHPSLAPPPPLFLLFSALWLRENPQFWKAVKAGLCSRRAFVIRHAPGKKASRGNISKVETGWNGSFLTALYLLYQPPCVCIHQHIEWSVKPLSWLITDCLRRGQVSTQLRALQRVGAVIIQC